MGDSLDQVEVVIGFGLQLLLRCNCPVLLGLELLGGVYNPYPPGQRLLNYSGLDWRFFDFDGLLLDKRLFFCLLYNIFFSLHLTFGRQNFSHSLAFVLLPGRLE